jgi:hypothetical protein
MKDTSLNFEKVWLMFQETDKKFQETDKKFQETDKKFQDMAKLSKETDKKLRSLETLFTGQWGKLMESLVEGDLVKLLKQRGLSVNQTYQRIKKIFNGQEFEFDLIAKNGIDVVIVEVKTTLRQEDVDHFLHKLELLKEVFPEYKDNKVYGAITYLRSESESHQRAMRKGLFVIRATGNSSSIINSTDFQPTVF